MCGLFMDPLRQVVFRVKLVIAFMTRDMCKSDYFGHGYTSKVALVDRKAAGHQGQHQT